MEKLRQGAMPTDKGEKKKKVITLLIVIVGLLAVFFVFNIIVGGKFLTFNNIKIIFAHAIYPSFIAWGICFIFTCGFLDMSVGSIIIISAMMTALFGNMWGYIGVILGGVISAFTLVMINFSVYIFSRVPSWIAGISLAMIYEAIAIFLAKNPATKKLVTAELAKPYRFLGQLPYSLIILVVATVIFYFLYSRMTIGINIRAIGCDQKVSSAIGINIKKTLIISGVIVGIVIGVAGFMEESYVANVTAKSGLTSINLVFQPMAVVLLAQILQRKINIMIAVPLCSILIYTVFNMLTMLGIPSGTLQEAVLGAFVLVFGIIGQRGFKGVVK